MPVISTARYANAGISDLPDDARDLIDGRETFAQLGDTVIEQTRPGRARSLGQPRLGRTVMNGLAHLIVGHDDLIQRHAPAIAFAMALLAVARAPDLLAGL